MRRGFFIVESFGAEQFFVAQTTSYSVLRKENPIGFHEQLFFHLDNSEPRTVNLTSELCARRKELFTLDTCSRAAQ